MTTPESTKTNPEYLNNAQNSKEVAENNDFEKTKKEIEKVLKEIEVSLGKTTIMVFRVWIVHPEMFSELKGLKEKFEENKKNMSRESTCDILWKVRDLINKYWNPTEKSIMKDLGDCLFKLQQTRSEWIKMKNFDDAVISIDGNIWWDVKKFVESIETLKSAEDTPNSTINTWSPFIWKES